jgi:hypothetical protein
MSKSVEDVKNELTGLQYSIDQIQLSKINIDLLFISNASFTRDLLENSETYFESREKSRKEWERKVTEAAGLEYDESKPFDREKVYEILGDDMDEISESESKKAFHNSENDEIERFFQHVEDVKVLEDQIHHQIEAYLELFPPNQQSDFHFMVDALQNFVEWTGDYSKRLNSFKKGDGSEKLLDEFRISSEFVSLCCNWLSSTVSTVLKYGFGGSESESI